jgi:hypothetical protein
VAPRTYHPGTENANMKKRKWIVLAVSGGVLLGLESCLSDLGYYLLETFVDYLPDLLDAWLETATETT